MKKFFLIKQDFVNSRLDRWFRRNICEVPQSLIEKNLRKGRIKVNNEKKKSSYKLVFNDKIILNNINFKSKIKVKEKIKYNASKKDISLSSSIFIENNSNFVVINKPAGISVQSGTKSRRNILDILRSTPEFHGSDPYTVHRIDKDTTGVLIVAKNRKFAQLFTSLFRIRKIYKSYLAIVLGKLNTKKGSFIDNLFYYEGKKKIITKAITHYNVIDSCNNYSLLMLNPETGRKHQLRKQLLIHGTPILGDHKYSITRINSKNKNNLMLHAYNIKFSINGVKYNYFAELPPEFKKNLKEKYLKNF
tara:strand:+ start:156 stop:1067 length:912 start_codon:yes stop_codon:yes gene_type:complete